MSGEPARYVYWVQLTSGFGPKAKSFVVIFECLHPTTDAIAAELCAHGVVNGSRLETVDDGRGGRLIRERRGFMFGVAGLIGVQPYHKACWEPEA